MSCLNKPFVVARWSHLYIAIHNMLVRLCVALWYKISTDIGRKRQVGVAQTLVRARCLPCILGIGVCIFISCIRMCLKVGVVERRNWFCVDILHIVWTWQARRVKGFCSLLDGLWVGNLKNKGTQGTYIFKQLTVQQTAFKIWIISNLWRCVVAPIRNQIGKKNIRVGKRQNNFDKV